MPSYKAPLRDMQFVLHEVCQFSDVVKNIPTFQHLDSETIDSVLAEAAKFNENVLQPLNQIGDAEGCQFHQGEVKTPKGFKEAYRQFVEAGWMALSAPEEFGGQNLPKMSQLLMDEMLASSNTAFSLYCVLTQGAVHALELHGSEEIKQTYLHKLVSGEWGGTMCLTEPHCGTDLSLVRTKAERQSEGSYKISGTKIFITSGEHDLTDNIVHTVLARLPDAPAGIKGISLFLVPKYHVQADGSLGARNPVFCGAIEHKMGIKGSATCVMNFDGATGYLLAQENQGMRAMFDMMNLERINIGLEGLGLAEVAYQNALQYAKDRVQGRALTGAKCPDKNADPLLVHPDIRRMLLTIKSMNEAARALLCWAGSQVDIAHAHPDEAARAIADDYVAFLTPIIKAFFSDYGFEACNSALQVLGGHGYIKEWGMEQFVRDARIAQIYEGANGIQALDLVKRKLMMNQGASVKRLAKEIEKTLLQANPPSALAEVLPDLGHALGHWLEVSEWIIKQANQHQDEAGAASVDYLKMSGLVCFAWMWAKMLAIAAPKASQDTFYATKVKTAKFFYQRILPEVESLRIKILAGAESMMGLDESEF